MRLSLRIFISSYVLLGVALALFTDWTVFAGQRFMLMPLETSEAVLLRIVSWPIILMQLFGEPGTGYGYLGATLAVISIVILYAISVILESVFS